MEITTLSGPVDKHRFAAVLLYFMKEYSICSIVSVASLFLEKLAFFSTSKGLRVPECRDRVLFCQCYVMEFSLYCIST